MIQPNTGNQRSNNTNTNRRPGRRRAPIHKDEFNDKVLDLRRVTRVTAGGKRFRFRATVAIGDEKGKIGIGVAKGADVQQAIAKARSDAKKNVIKIQLNDRTIMHEVEAKFSAARVRLKPAKPGHGLVAGGAARIVLTLAGVKDIAAKSLGRTTNKLTNALATIRALQKLRLKKPKSKPRIRKEVVEETSSLL